MKLVKDAYAKVPGVQWAMYERAYGDPLGKLFYLHHSSEIRRRN